MTSIIYAAIAMVIMSASTASAVNSGDYYEGLNRNDVKPPASVSSSSFGYPGAMSRATSLAAKTTTPPRVNSGDYYKGASRPI